MLDIAVSKPCLQRPGIVSRIRQGITACMPQHVRVDWESHSGPLAEPRDQGMEALGGHRAAALGGEHVRPRRLFALQAPQCPYLVALYRMNRRRATLGPPDVEAPGAEFDLVPL